MAVCFIAQAAKHALSDRVLTRKSIQDMEMYIKPSCYQEARVPYFMSNDTSICTEQNPSAQEDNERQLNRY